MLQPAAYSGSLALSQSEIKLFRKSLIRFYREIEQGDRQQGKSTNSTDVGDIVDCLCTNPDGLKDYKIVEGVKCSDTVKTIVVSAYSAIVTYCEEQGIDVENSNGLFHFVLDMEKNCKSFLIRAGRMAEYQSNYGDDALFRDLVKKGGKYLESLAESYGQNIIDKSIYDKANKGAEKAFRDPKVGPLLKLQDSDDYFVLKQKPLFGRYLGIEQKILPDLAIGVRSKKVIYPYDIKTCFELAQFMKNFRKFGYGYQASYYDNVLQQNYPDFDIQPFRFIAIPIETEEPVMTFKMATTETIMYAEGGYNKQNERIIGWKESMDDIAWHRKHQRWDYPRAYIEAGDIVIDSIYSESDYNNDPL